LRHGLGPDHLAAHLGGDEFAIALPTTSTRATALQIAERVRALLDEPVEVAGTSLSIAATSGAALAPGHGTDADTLLRHAEIALYKAKDNRGSVAVYDPAMDPHSLERLQLLSDLKGALARGKFIVHYQPQADAATGEIIGAEALLRWMHPTLGVVSPATFIPLLERTSLMSPVALEVLRQALTQARAWPTGTEALTVAVSLSAGETTDLELPGAIARLLATYDVDPGRLTLEVTETTVMTDPSRAAAVLRELREIGVRVSIDDFGTGYSYWTISASSAPTRSRSTAASWPAWSTTPKPARWCVPSSSWDIASACRSSPKASRAPLSGNASPPWGARSSGATISAVPSTLSRLAPGWPRALLRLHPSNLWLSRTHGTA